MEDPDYEPKPVAYLVRVDDGGKLLGIEGTHTTPPAEGKKASDMVKEATEAVSKAKPVRTGPKVGRNDPCPCGSGKKYKNCCGR